MNTQPPRILTAAWRTRTTPHPPSKPMSCRRRPKSSSGRKSRQEREDEDEIVWIGEGSADEIRPAHLAEAVGYRSYRSLDGTSWA